MRAALFAGCVFLGESINPAMMEYGKITFSVVCMFLIMDIIHLAAEALKK